MSINQLFLLLRIAFLIACATIFTSPPSLSQWSAENARLLHDEPWHVLPMADTTPTKSGFRFVSLRFEPTNENNEVGLSSAPFESAKLQTLDSSSFLDQMTLGNSEIDLSPLRQPPEKLAFWDRLASDQSNFYSRESLVGFGLILGAGALMANTDADAQLQKHFHSSVRGATSDEWFEFLHANKELGNGVYILPVTGMAWLANEYIDGPPAFEKIGVWGERSMRGFIVGAPPLVLMQQVTGGSRPNETPEGSEWHPFRDNNGVSGHAFMSSLPFITAAKLTDNPWEKTLWYMGSTIGPLSRVNDNAHYPSQIGMGWAMAFMAATAVQQTDTGKRGWRLMPNAPSGENGFSLRYQW